MHDDRTSRLRSSMIQTSGRQCQEFPRFLTWFSFFCARFGTALRSKITPTKNLRSFRFDRGYASRLFFFVPFGALPSYNDCIMTIAVSIFICGSAKSSRFALPVACTRARLLISCLPIFLLFIFARSSSSAVRNLTHPWVMHCVTFLRAALIIDPHCTSYEFMIALLIGNVDWRLPVFPQSGNFYANYEHAIFYSIPLPINDHALQT